MLKDRIVIHCVQTDIQGNITKKLLLHDVPVWMCRDLCSFSNENKHCITGDYLLSGVFEVTYIKSQYTHLQRLLIRLLQCAILNQKGVKSDG